MMKFDEIVIEDNVAPEFPLDFLSPHYYDLSAPQAVVWEDLEFVESTNRDRVTGAWHPIEYLNKELIVRIARSIGVNYLIFGIDKNQTKFFFVGFLPAKELSEAL